MAGLSSYCRICGAAKDISEYAENTCGKCETTRLEAMQGAKAENATLSEDQLIYIGRQALAGRAVTAHQTWTNPRDFRRSDFNRT